MQPYKTQIIRITEKLLKARKVDKELKVFGAHYHKYVLGSTVKESELIVFEQKYNISLPACYRSFLLNIGNGGVSHMESGAGPFYGIYPLGINVTELVNLNSIDHLSEVCALYPWMSNEYWDELNHVLNSSENLSDDEYELELKKIYAGLMPLGAQGDAYLHALVITGEFRGKVVNIDLGRDKPKFAFEDNFLDWYERWLDEVISGELVSGQQTWFGYRMAGTDVQLWEKYCSTNVEYLKISSIIALWDKTSVKEDILTEVEGELPLAKGEIKTLLLDLLAKFNFLKANPYLVELAETDLKSAVQIASKHAGKYSLEWLPNIRSQLERITDGETFYYACQLLSSMNIDHSDLLISAFKSQEMAIRMHAINYLAKTPSKEKHLEYFIEGLQDPAQFVVHASLQALTDIKNFNLLPHYKALAHRYTEEDDYILSNLTRNLLLYSLTLDELKKKSDIDLQNKKKSWFQFWR